MSNQATKTERIPFDTQPCDKLADCQEPAEWRYPDGAQLCSYHSREREGTLPPTIANLQAQLGEARAERDAAVERGREAIRNLSRFIVYEAGRAIRAEAEVKRLQAESHPTPYAAALALQDVQAENQRLTRRLEDERMTRHPTDDACTAQYRAERNAAIERGKLACDWVATEASCRNAWVRGWKDIAGQHLERVVALKAENERLRGAFEREAKREHRQGIHYDLFKDCRLGLCFVYHVALEG